MHRTGFLILAAAISLAAQTAAELDFLTGQSDGRDLRQMLPSYLRAKAAERLEARRREVARISSPEQLAARRRYIRERIAAEVGGFPERTPLNAKTVATLERDGYRIEKILFESQPRFYVTANLYLPKRGAAPYPAVLFPLGHESGAKANPVWQTILMTLARNGYAALAWDTLGQGERIQLYDADFKASKLRQSTMEHTVQGIQCLLTGDALARYTIWDGIRALDYLVSRPEVDPKRIACTGNSGGGTHTAYLAALDDRIQVAAPSCYITGWKRLLETIGPQDAEQCFPGFLADGLDHADFLYAFAPKPLIVLSAIRDFFSISGARESFAETRELYARMGAAEKIAMTEADDGHGYSEPRRLAAYRWLERWLKGAEGELGESNIQIASESELFCTPTGQVATSLGGETVDSLNRKRAEGFRRAVPSTAEIRRLTGYEPSSSPLNVRSYGRSGRMERLVYDSEPGIRIPALLYLPEREGRHPAVVLAHGRGKAAAHDDARQLAAAGYAVLSIDARGFGETRAVAETKGSEWSQYFGDYDSAMTAILLGRTLVGMRALDVVRGVDLLESRADVDASRIFALGKGAAATAVLHAAALDSRIRKVALEGMLESYLAVVNGRIHRGIFEQVVPGALRSYDLSHLAASLAPREVRIAGSVDPLGNPAGAAAKINYPEFFR